MQVGSGFDVSSAVFGSQIYRRFSPSRLEPLLTREVSVVGRREWRMVGPQRSCDVLPSLWSHLTRKVLPSVHCNECWGSRGAA